jgi:hypothetical protein
MDAEAQREFEEQEKANQERLRQWAETGVPPPPDLISVTFHEGERQMVLLALAQMALNRPGWKIPLEDLAKKLKGLGMFENFKRDLQITGK